MELGDARIVTVSAAYGAGGSVVAPQLAERLGLPFFNRLIPDDRHNSGDAIRERLTAEERDQAPPGRIVASLSALSSTLGLPVTGIDDMDPRIDLRRRVETSVTRIATDGGGVILGRAGAVVLAGTRNAFHVRLYGPAEACKVQGAEIEAISLAEAAQHQADSDRAWTRFVNRLFDRNPQDASLYHLLIDSTAIPLTTTIELVSQAAHAFWQHSAQ
ncbi:MAG TPA: cytidylate kinase-like family protein [Ilumatobacteraceae bacterium]|nr:cytidylate kinase-like family protein [Ilumatobacteraceae bacterium]